MQSLVSNGPVGPRLPRASGALEFQRDLVALIPFLRALSQTLCRSRVMAEDMAQEALAKAWCYRDRFEPGSNLKGWLFTILRNEVYSQKRRAWREADWKPDFAERIPVPAHEQDWAIELSDTARSLTGLPRTQREALILVSVGGFTYKDVAGMCNMPLGTVKSRVARARHTLSSILAGDEPRPPRYGRSALDASDDVLAQLTALAPRNADGFRTHA